MWRPRQHILPAVNKFLKANPTECVIFCVAQDNSKGSPLDRVLHDILMQGLPANTLYDADTDAILRKTLGELKGSVVLLRQDRPQTFGVDVSNWPDDDANSSTGFAPLYTKSGKVVKDKNGNVVMAGSIRMQNAYEYGITTSYGIGEKWKNVKAHLVRAEQSPRVATPFSGG